MMYCHIRIKVLSNGMLSPSGGHAFKDSKHDLFILITPQPAIIVVTFRNTNS